MSNRNENILPEVFLSESDTSRTVSNMVKLGTARKIGPRLYTRNMSEPVEIIVARNRWQIVGMLVPEGVIGFRTALESHPADDGSVFVTCGYKKITKLPGLRIVRIPGSGPVEGDMPFIGGLHMASPSRLLLENLSHTKARKGATKAAGQKAVEEKLTSILRIKGENELNRIRDLARTIAADIGLEKEFQLLDRLIGSLLQTREADLKSPVARAYFSGEPYDPVRLEQFEALRSTLARTVLPSRNRTYEPGPAFYNESFFDAYFSNFIEGTEFEVDEALGIVFSGVIPQSRPEDAHDICRIIIPSVYRNEYIASLKLLSNHKDPAAFLRVMDVAQDFISRIDFSDLVSARHILERCNAFERPADTVKLMMPSS